MLGYEPIGHIASDFRTAGPQRFDKTALHCRGNLAKVIGGLGLRGLAFGLGGGGFKMRLTHPAASLQPSPGGGGAWLMQSSWPSGHFRRTWK